MKNFYFGNKTLQEDVAYLGAYLHLSDVDSVSYVELLVEFYDRLLWCVLWFCIATVCDVLSN